MLTRAGLILTNDHVITREGKGPGGAPYRDLLVYFKPDSVSGDNREDLETGYLAEIVARDAKLDLALLRVRNPPANLRPIAFGDSEEVEIGEPVAAIGHPGGGGLWTLTTGTVSSRRQDGARDIFQTDAAINPGNSGGPLLDEHARLIGINTFVRRLDGKGVPLEGLNYSLRSGAALRWINAETGAGLRAVPRPRARPAQVTPERREGTPRIRRPAPQAESQKRADARRDTPSGPRRPAPKSGLLPGLLPSGLAPAGSAPRVTRNEAADQEAPLPPPRKARRSPRQPSYSVDRIETPRIRDDAPSGGQPEPGFQRFRGPRGETLYGVPNPEVGLRDTLRQARRGFRAITERADDSIHEMEDRLDRYENF